MNHDPLQIPEWSLVRSGKVRDLYKNSEGQLLIVASDRVSAFDWVLPTTIPHKGAILTQLSLFWFELLADKNHLISGNLPSIVKNRAVLAKNLEMLPIECVARGYLSGSALSSYLSDGEICAIPLPQGLVNGSELPLPIFTPATKAKLGEHDENVDFHQVSTIVGEHIALELKVRTLRIYSRAREYAARRGVIIADTKFEFGIDDSGEIILADEVLTPDSSRFWPLESWKPGGAQASFDKQFLRDWLLSSGWDQRSSPPEIPREIVEKTSARYEEAFKRITGRVFQ
jgi:phosphoribosylaminoimidazole-succinocarboxamide synthase